jgi:hypothetical protein
MNINEFQAWLQGFGEAFDEAPTQPQWARIQQKLRDEIADNEKRTTVNLASLYGTASTVTNGGR